MLPAARAAFKPKWTSWLTIGLFGLVATGAGAFMPGLVPAEQPEAVASSPDAESLDYAPPVMPDFPSPKAMLLRLVGGTVVVLLLCVVTICAAKRWLGPFPHGNNESKELRLIETLALNGRCSVFLIQAGKTRALAGVDATGLKVLMPLSESFETALAESDATANENQPEAAFPRVA